MSDKLKELTPVLVSFVQGESPTPNKMENSFDQVSNAMNILERAVGDIWNQSSITAGPLDLNPNYIANLSRAVGNMSKLNPNSLGGNVLSVSGESVPTGKKIFALAHAPDDPATPAAIVFTNSTGVFDTLVVSLDLVDSAGDYFVDVSGLIYTYTETGASHTVSYDYTTVTDSYSGATYNVIPDPSQTGTRCSVATSGSGYSVSLPVVTDSGSPNYLQQLTIPSELSTLEVDDEIPAGFMYIWDNAVGENKIVEGITFKYTGTLTSVYAEGNILSSDPQRYSIITIGSQITKMMEGLRDLILNHDHQDNQTPFIDHTKIIGSDAAVAHGTTSDIVGIDDIQTITNKTLVDPLFFDTGGAGFVTNVIIRVFEGQVAFRNSLDTEYQPLNLNCVPDVLTGKSADQVDGIHASDTPTANQLLALDATTKFPNSVLETGHGNGLDADTLDGQHAPTGTIVGTSDTQELTNKELTSPKINSATSIVATGDQINEVTGGGVTALHTHAADIPLPTAYTYAESALTWSSAGTFPSALIVPGGITRLFIAIWGGGGGGGDGGFSKGSGGGGGGGGGFTACDIAVSPTDVVDVTVGAGGIQTSGSVGGTGGTSSVTVDSTVVATALGGGGGQLGWTGGTGAGIGTLDGSNQYTTEYSGLTFVLGGFFYDNISESSNRTTGGNGDGSYSLGGAGGSGGWGGNGGNASGTSNGSAGSAGTNPRFLGHENPVLDGAVGSSSGPGDGGHGGGRGILAEAGRTGRVQIFY